jgi:predicted esterase
MLRHRLHARPTTVEREAVRGVQPLEPGSERDSYLYVPPGYDAATPSPALLLLHGSGGHAHHGRALLRRLADERDLILIAPASREYIWDLGRRTEDTARVERALMSVFARYSIDSARLAIGGFSDGASWALTLGVANGELFTHVIAFSPTLEAPIATGGVARAFVSHGARDELVSVSACRRTVARLEELGVSVDYAEFEAGHRIPEEIARRAVDWLTGDARSARAPPPQQSPGSPRRREDRSGAARHSRD